MRVDGITLPLRTIREARLPTERQWLEAISEHITALAKS